MFRFAFPGTDTVLLLSARWRELSLLAQISVVIFCILVPAAVVMLYRYEMRLVRLRTATFLLALGLLVLLMLLSVVFLQPVVAHPKTEELHGRVLIAIDRSNSMKVADPQRPIVEKLLLARALKLGEGVDAQQLDAWIRQYEEKGLPEWVGAEEFPGDEPRRQKLAAERRRQHDAICQRLDQLTRLGIAQRLLDEKGADLLGAIGFRHKVDLLGFSLETWDIKPDGLDAMLTPFAELKATEPGAPANQPETDAKERARDDGTDLKLPLVRALERSGKMEGKILGVVLLTDGQHNRNDGEGKSPVDKAVELGKQEIPIYPIVFGARQPPPDVALVSLQAPPAVFKDVDISVEARVKISGLGAQEVELELQRKGQPPLHQRIQHDGHDRYYTVAFPLKMDQVGSQTLTVVARPVDGEIRKDNNSRQIVVNVADEKAKVLLVDGEARWEFHYILQALLRDRQMKVDSILFSQPRLGRIPEEELEKLGHPASHWPTDPNALAGYDCIVLGDVSPEHLPAAERLRLERYVSDRGGTLIILAGKRFMPIAFRRQSEAAAPSAEPLHETDPLLRLLPILQPRMIRPANGYRFAFTHQGQVTKFLEMDPVPSKSEKIWSGLPAHFWGIIGKAKPGASALAYVGGAEPAKPAPGAEPAAEPGRDQSFMVRQNYGFGRVLFLGLDSTWRWRYKTGDTYHHRFWSQVIHWAAADKPLVAGNEHIRFGSREAVYRQGTEVDLVARLGDSEKPLAIDALAGARVLRIHPDGKEQQAALVPLKRLPAQPRVLEGKAPPNLTPGQYAIELAIPELAGKLNGPPGPDGQPSKLRATFLVTASESEETLELAANWPLLDDIAVKSGGKTYTPDTAHRVVDELAKKVVTRQRDVETKVWEDWKTLLVFLVLLTCEWVTRKLAGLP